MMELQNCPCGRFYFSQKNVSYIKRFQSTFEKSHLEFTVNGILEEPYVNPKFSPLYKKEAWILSLASHFGPIHKIQRGLVQYTLFKMHLIQIAFCRESSVHSSFHKEVLHKSSLFQARELLYMNNFHHRNSLRQQTLILVSFQK